ncbi:MAG: helix-turn-helix transcriptional regulator [Phycisphaerales bacterium]
MNCQSLSEAIFRLGQTSSDPKITNHTLLDQLLSVAVSVIEVDAVTLAVFEHGLLGPAVASRISGPWDEERRARLHEPMGWDASERVIATRLDARPRNRVFRRAELIEPSELENARLAREIHAPLEIVDEAFGVFTRPDGTELYMSIHNTTKSGPIARRAMARTSSLGPYMAHAWAKAWKREPAWVARLKPQTKKVLESVLEGLDDDQIAESTGLTYHSVRAHLKRLFREAGVRSRLHLMQSFRAYSIPAAAICDEFEKRMSKGSDAILLDDPSQSAFGFEASRL